MACAAGSSQHQGHSMACLLPADAPFPASTHTAACAGEQYAGLVQEHDDGGRLSTIPLSTVQATSSSLSQSRATGSHR